MGYIAGRLFRAAVTVLGIVTLVFLVVRLVPGDPVDAIVGDQASPEDKAELRKTLGLDRSLPEQYVAFLGDVANGSLGTSFRKRGTPVSQLIGEVLWPTALLAIASLLVAWCLAVPLGVLASVNRGNHWDTAASTFAVAGLAIPNIWLGPLLILLFAVQLRWLPLPGGETHVLRGLILPAFTVGTALAAVLTRQTRAAMIEVLGEQYILAARARGLSRSQVVLRHALRNALIPVLTIGAAQLGALLSGTVITEKIFERQGLGTLFLEAFFTRDFPLIQGCVLVFGIVFVVVNFAVDLLYTAIDPRVKLR